MEGKQNAATQPSSSNPTTYFNLPSHFNYPNIYCSGVESENASGLYSAFPIMPLKSDGSLCLMEAITRSQSQGLFLVFLYLNMFPFMLKKFSTMCCLLGMVSSTPPKLENFFGGVTMGTPDFDRGGATMALGLDSSTMYYNQNPDHETLQHNHRHQQHQIQPQHYPDYSGFRALYQTVQQEEVKEAQIAADSCNLHLPSIGEDDDINSMKNWISRNYHSGIGGGDHGGGGGYGDLQSLSLSMSFGCSQSQQQIIPPANVTDCVVLDSKKRGSEKVDQQKQIVHRKSLDTFGQRTSQYRGVTSFVMWVFSESVSLSGIDGLVDMKLICGTTVAKKKAKAGREDKFWCKYDRKMSGYDMEEKAARAYDLAALKYWGPATHINFPLENYEQEVVEMKNMRSSGFSRGASVYRGVTRHHQHGRWQARIGRVAGNKDLYLGTFKPSNDLLSDQITQNGDQPNTTTAATTTTTTANATATTNMLDWKMALYDQNATTGTGLEGDDQSSKLGTHLSNASSLVTSLSSSREDSPERNNNLPMILGTPPSASKFLGNSNSNSSGTWIPTGTTQLRPHIPVFAAWTDA
ncbi:AP2/ERF domain-containing protein [Cynara cardunculus var. scolymus]|uniref:AP2/ERF domain-containing protein n=1 Tax=Cynara cardunculus var. scolymus TaxID=59895 RepID=A0A103Y586_CYNCS|nr:AP2/ERF domain-containing protein [Cynara cardunculus var. scolymus]